MARSETWSKSPRFGMPLAFFGTPLSPNTKASRMSMIRVFFDTLIEGGLIRRRFATRTVFRLPQEIAKDASPKPRDFHDDVWAKLLWAGLSFERSDLSPTLRSHYPIEMLQGHCRPMALRRPTLK